MNRLHVAMLSAGLSCAMASPNLAAVCTEPQLFRPATSTALDARPNRVVLADLNHDDILDVALPRRDSDSYVAGNSIAVMLGNGSGGGGDGTFGPPTFHLADSGPQAIAVADLDGDSHVDLAVSNWASNSISILSGGGDGTFSAPNNIPCGPVPYGIAAAHLNHDGIIDLAVAMNGAAQVSVLMGLGGGAFAAPVSYPVGDLSLSIEVADVDGDGEPDLIATARTQGMAVLLGIGDGTFQPAQHYATGGQPYTLALADVDVDGNPDLLAGNQANGGLAVLRGSATGTFGTPAVYGAGVWTVGGIAIGDVDGDGIADVSLTNATGNAVVLLKGQGSGGVGNGVYVVHSAYPAASYPVGIAMGQLNGDGLPDVVVASYLSSDALTLLGSCTSPPPLAPQLTSVRDVPNDDGGQVFVTWTASALDILGGSVTQYRVWRRIPAQVVLARLAAGVVEPLVARTVGLDGATVVYWEALATLPAQRLEGYGYTAATTQDSMRNSNPYTAFFVSALTPNIDVFYSSNVDSGYSVDNIKPQQPTGFAADRTGAGISLNWEANEESDLAAYRLFRGTTADFVPSDENLIATPTDPEYVDAGALGDQYYKLAAIDVHGNESEYAMVPPLAPVDVGDVAAASFELRGAVPNPSPTGMLSIHLSLPRGSEGQLEVLDLAGRRVASRTLTGLAHGPQVIVLGERAPLPSGVYLIRLMTGERRKDVKAIVMR